MSILLQEKDDDHEKKLEDVDKSRWIFPQKLRKIGGRPPIHSQRRQELCEALPYFRSYQGGHYVSNKRTMGYLLDGCPSPRDVFEDSGKVIISHGGGGSKICRPLGWEGPPQLTLVKSQTRENFRVKALIKCMEEGLPVVLVAGRKYSGMPWIQDYPAVRYAVLGHYLVTHSWPEREFRSDDPNEYSVRFKFRFQWVSSQGDPWWLSDMEKYYESLKQRQSTSALGSSESDESKKHAQAIGEMDWEASRPVGDLSTTDHHHDMLEVEDEELVEYKCNGCGKESFKAYKGSWMCLNEACWDFFKDEQHSDFFRWSSITSPSDIIHIEGLKYVGCFLRHQTCLENELRVPFQLTPTTLQNLSGHQLELTAHLEPRIGFYCSSCGRLSIRIYWRVLICSNEECRFTVNLTGAPLKLPRPTDLPRNGRKMSRTRYDISSLDPIGPLETANYSLRWYRFHDNSGGVIHATPVDLRKADFLFQEFQTLLDAWSFKRNQLKFSQVDGLVAQTFTLNCGETYQYCTEVETRPWLETPLPIFRAYSRLSKFVRDVLNHEVILSSSKKIGLDDLLPENFNEILSCFYLPGTGMNYHSDNELGLGSVIGSLSLGSTAIMKFKRKQKTSPGLKQEEETPVKKSNLPILELVLKHGDIVLQCGSQLQENYLHSLYTDGVRISTTIRHINSKLNSMR